MKILCECGHEGTIHCPPRFDETSAFAMGHGHVARTVKVICICGAEMTTGPGAFPNPFLGGMMAGQFFAEHAGCEQNAAGTVS
jgi:hypothetical protein